MSFAIVASLIGAGVSLYSSNKQAQQAKKLQKQQQPLIDAQTGLATSMAPYATGFFQRAQQAYDPAAEYYKALASGDSARIAQATAAQRANINTKYGSLIRTSRELSPRSGASASFNAELPYRAGDETQALVNNEVSGAYGHLASLSSEAGALGQGAGAVASGSATGGNNLLMSQYGVGRQSAQDQAKAYQDFLNGLDTAWTSYQGSKKPPLPTGKNWPSGSPPDTTPAPGPYG